MTYRIRIAGSDLSFPCDPGHTVLDAALLAGIELPYSCRKGVCGNCSAPVVSGNVCRGRVDEGVARQGEELLCQCKPEGDLEIAPAVWRRTPPQDRRRLRVRLYRKHSAASGISILHLRLPIGQRVRFRAGQYLQVLLPDGSRRNYSMANPPHESDSLLLHVRHVEGGQFSAFAAAMQPGQELEVELPFGQVEIDPQSESPLVCVCGGTGFAPVKSLLDDLARRRSARPVTLVWGARRREGLYLFDHLARWERTLSDWRLILAIEDADDARAAGARTGRVDEVMPEALAGLHDPEVYCCGPVPMVAAVRLASVQRGGVRPDRFRADAFAEGPAPAAA